MYRPVSFAVDDVPVLYEFVRDNPFATIAVAIAGTIHFAYAPVLLDGNGAKGVARFHLALRNPVSAIPDATPVTFSFLGPHAYISSDWYRTLVTVPTWNYMAVQASGSARRLSPDELRQLLVDLSAAEESHLLPKPPWTMDKVPETRVAALMGAIVGFEVALDTLEGKFKLSQDKNPEDVAGVIAALEETGVASNLAVAAAMRKQVRE